MKGPETQQAEDRLFLRSRLPDMVRLPPWIESLAARHTIPENIQYAMNLCLEEAVSNIILHGYEAGSEGSVTVSFASPEPNLFVFVVDDDARRFNPLDAPAPDPQGQMKVGGQGIHFLRHFADSVEYEVTPTGNRLKIAFSAKDEET